jgi:hypothetical protein
MKISAWDKTIEGPSNATVVLDSNDTVSVAYPAADGTTHVISIIARHMVLIAQHEATEKAIVCRPGRVSVVN